MIREFLFGAGMLCAATSAFAGTDFETARKTADCIVLADETFVEAGDSGAVFRFFKRVKICTADGAFSQRLAVHDFAETASAAFVAARVISANGEARELDCARAFEDAVPAPGMRRIALEIGRLNPGDVLEWRVEEKRVPASGTAADAPAVFCDVVSFGSADFPVEKKVYSLAPNLPIQYRADGGNVRSEARFRGDGKIEYRFSAENLAPLSQDSAPKLRLATERSWEEKSRRLFREADAAGAFRISSALQRKADDLVADVADESEKIARIAHWVADCARAKDKISALVGMLRAIGMDAFPAATVAGTRADDVPAAHFSDAIVIVKTAAGKTVALDPVRGAFSRDLSPEPHRLFLPIVSDGAAPGETPESAAENHHLRVSVAGTLSADGSLEAEYSLEAEGAPDAAIRREFIENRVADWTARLERELLAIAPNAEILEIALGNDWRAYREMPLKFTARFRIPQYAAVADDGTIFYEPVVLKNVFAGARSRRAFPQILEFSESIRLPFNVAETSGETKTDAFSETILAEKNTLRFSKKQTAARVGESGIEKSVPEKIVVLKKQ